MSNEFDNSFMKHEDTNGLFSKMFPTEIDHNFEKWFKLDVDSEKVYQLDDRIGNLNFGDVVDSFYEWRYKTPYEQNPLTNPHSKFYDEDLKMFTKKDTKFCCTDATPFEDPSDFRTFTMYERCPLLVSPWNMSAAYQEFPSCDSEDKLVNLIVKDLMELDPRSVKVTFDGDEVIGSCLIRTKCQSISNVPPNNSIGIPEDRLTKNNNTVNLCHAGLYCIFKPEILTSGDHLITLEAKGKNFRIKAEILAILLV